MTFHHPTFIVPFTYRHKDEAKHFHSDQYKHSHSAPSNSHNVPTSPYKYLSHSVSQLLLTQPAPSHQARHHLRALALVLTRCSLPIAAPPARREELRTGNWPVPRLLVWVGFHRMHLAAALLLKTMTRNVHIE
ncbi:hypothetical protein SNOG_11854 [Parastagonospora nodorum SN15]|uniref:Uncharacterized protein n=1 Tax=Phaeosphaeria nodorum (strain SN15 / ATCC MYA-4574 / FGSC 10173) TaxID=321614 RepID=Q0U8R0_PHANO|nr:hypothetical protein SNOG_11854 [Parastagonospora nodorum SN15]EAT80898.1 hypothetical protein SNOG_11854 [Parastagonospora nodorum SN15]